MKYREHFIRFIFALLLLCYSFTVRALPTITVVGTNGTCVSDCKITVNTANVTGTASYSLINYPAVGQNTPPQASNIFDGLEPGSYTVGVYDATTAGTPVMAKVTVTTSYVDMLSNTPVPGNVASTEICGTPGPNGTLRISFT